MERELLTERQKEVLKALMVEEGNKAAGKTLKIKPRTLQTHLHNVRTRLGTSGAFQSLVWAAENKIVDLRIRFPQEEAQKLLDKLTPAEFNTLCASVSSDGRLKDYKEVADDLDKSPYTIKAQREAVRTKMGVGIVVAGLMLIVATAAGYKYIKRRKG